MIVKLDEGEIREIIGEAERHSDAVLGLYRYLFETCSALPDWDECVEHVSEYPVVNRDTNKMIFSMFMRRPQEFSKKQRIPIVNWGPWLNSGWSSSENYENKLQYCEVYIPENCFKMKMVGCETADKG